MILRQTFGLFVNALKLSRANNLIIVFLTQYFAAIFLIGGSRTMLDIVSDFRFFIVVFSTVIISASGYFINDYYDIKIDLINKPQKVIVGKHLRRRQVMLAHLAFNSVGILLGALVSLWIGLINLIAAFLLWLYSNQLKRQPFIGNFVVAILTAATLLMLGVYYRSIDILLLTYAFFAFGINLIREIIKDMEDVKGDASFGSQTLPVILGIRKTKWILYFLSGLYLIALVFFLQKLNSDWLNIYFAVLFLPFCFFIYLIVLADTKKHFTFLSIYCKWIILAGILSMTVLNI